MKALKLYEQLKQLVDEGKITEGTEVIATGQYNLGLGVYHCTMNKMAPLNDDTVIAPPNDVLCLYVDSYLRETEDIGCSNLWVDEDDYNSFAED